MYLNIEFVVKIGCR